MTQDTEGKESNQLLLEMIENVRSRAVKKHSEMLRQLNSPDCTKETQDKAAKIVMDITKYLYPDLDERNITAIVSTIVGLGVVDALLEDKSISEIMVNTPNDIYIERNGMLEKTDLSYPSAEVVREVVTRIAQRCGRQINSSSPLVDARLPDGSRVNAVIPPASVYPVITIRRFGVKVFTTPELSAQNFLSKEMVSFFETVVAGKANIIICGAASTGKSTFLRWLSSFIPGKERVITIEDTRELNLDCEHCIALEQSDKASIYDLVINSLRMRPDRIILGELRGEESFELLDAMGTGHDGTLTSVHTNSDNEEAINRLVRAMSKSKQVNDKVLKSMICQGVDLLVFLKRFPDGTRKITSVTQVQERDGQPVFNDIFAYRRKEDAHYQVGVIDDYLLAKLQDNLTNKLPEIKSLGGGVRIA